MDLVDFLLIVGVVVAAFVIWLLTTVILIWAERKIIARMQSRIGPNRLGPAGILQTLADGVKLFFKEDIAPRNVDKFTYIAAPFASAVVAFLAFAVVPFGNVVEIAGRSVRLQVWDPEIGLLWILAMSSIGVYGIVLAGWSSGSKYPLLGGVRSSAQMISYELAMALGLAAVFIYTGSLRASDIVANQAGTFLGFVPAWHVIPMAPAFILFFASAVAETQRPPFDLPEAEGELVGGFHTEYSGAKFAMFFLAEFMNTITMSAVVVTMFLGGPAGPLFGPAWLQAILGVFYFLAKVWIVLFIFVWLRATLPRVRYDRLMDLGWKVMLPFGLLWVLATAAAVLVRETAPPDALIWLTAGAVVVALLLVLIGPLVGSRPAEPDTGNGGGGGGGGDEPPPPPDGAPGGREIMLPDESAIDEPARGRTPEEVGAH